jgi:16S rRNA (uracil1498-N3)-methyltransferase
LHFVVPVADRDRMLLLAEKAAEFAVETWRPVLWRRSRSVVPRGEGAGFQRKVRARMVGAAEQSGSAWLPSVYPDSRLEHALAALPAGVRLVLDPNGDPLPRALGAQPRAPVTIALGPEGGLDPAELAALADAGFVKASLGPATLRFETAGIGALACARSVTIEPETPS